MVGAIGSPVAELKWLPNGPSMEWKMENVHSSSSPMVISRVLFAFYMTRVL